MRHILDYHKKHKKAQEVKSPVDKQDLNLMNVIKAFFGEDVSNKDDLDIVTNKGQETNDTDDVGISEEDPNRENKAIPDEFNKFK